MINFISNAKIIIQFRTIYFFISHEKLMSRTNTLDHIFMPVKVVNGSMTDPFRAPSSNLTAIVSPFSIGCIKDWLTIECR